MTVEGAGAVSAFEARKRLGQLPQPSEAAAEDEVFLAAQQDKFGGQLLEDGAAQPSSNAVSLSTWDSSARGACGGWKSGWLRMRIGRDASTANALKATFIGQYELRVVQGSVAICGAILSASPDIFRVYAPSTHALPGIAQYGSAESADVEIRKMEGSMRPLAHVSPLFRRIWNDARTHEPKQMKGINEQGFSFLKGSRDDPMRRELTPLDFSQTVDRLCPANGSKDQIIFVCGRRNAGKSTLCRGLVNRKLCPIEVPLDAQDAVSAVYYLDLDPGQCEFTPQGQVSLVRVMRPLFGPPYSHPFGDEPGAMRIIKTHCLSSNRYDEDEQRYMDCCLDLMREYKKLMQEFKILEGGPCIVNTPAMQRGDSAESARIGSWIDELHPTDLWFFGQPDHPIAAQLRLVARGGSNRVQFKWHAPIGDSKPGRTAAHLRDMMSLSYFHAIVSERSENQRLQWHSQPVCQHQSGLVKMNTTVPELHMTVEGCQPIHHDDFDPSLGARTPEMVRESLLTAVEANIVALVWVIRPDTVDTPHWTHQHHQGDDALQPANDAGTIAAVSPRNTQLICLALVRGREAGSGKLKVYTPQADILKDHLDKGHTIVALRRRVQMSAWAHAELIFKERIRRAELRQQAVREEILEQHGKSTSHRCVAM